MDTRETDCSWGLMISGLVLAIIILGVVLGNATQAERQNALDRLETKGRGASHWSGQEWAP